MKILVANWLISVIIFLISSSIFLGIIAGIVAMLFTPAIITQCKQRKEL